MALSTIPKCTSDSDLEPPKIDEKVKHRELIKEVRRESFSELSRPIRSDSQP